MQEVVTLTNPEEQYAAILTVAELALGDNVPSKIFSTFFRTNFV